MIELTKCHGMHVTQTYQELSGIVSTKDRNKYHINNSYFIKMKFTRTRKLITYKSLVGFVLEEQHSNISTFRLN